MLKLVLIYLLAGGLGTLAIWLIYVVFAYKRLEGCSVKESIEYVRSQNGLKEILKDLLWIVTWPIMFPFSVLIMVWTIKTLKQTREYLKEGS